MRQRQGNSSHSSFESLIHYSQLMTICHGEDQNKPPQNVPLWHVDYFELKAINTQQIQEKLLSLPQLPNRFV